MNINFCTPVKYTDHTNITFGQRTTEAIDSFFNFGGRIAVVIPGSKRKDSEEVKYEESFVSNRETIFKVIACATLIIPLIMFIAKIVMRSLYSYHVCKKMKPSPQVIVVPHQIEKPQPQTNPSKNKKRPPKINTVNRIVGGDEVSTDAPLTLVRSERPANLKISILYNQRFKPQEPTFPKPTDIKAENGNSKYTWNVLTHDDGTLTTSSKNGITQRINMIWWESVRHEKFANLDKTKAVCIKKCDLKKHLEKTLLKAGVKATELEAFVQYWIQTFKRDYDSENTPYMLVELVDDSALKNYIPDLKVEGKDAHLFGVKRFYFRFEPISQPVKANDAKSYFSSLKAEDLGSNVVIDLGGEVSPNVKGRLKQKGEDAFNASFIKKYILVS